MLIQDVSKLSPIERWTYWIEERDGIRVKRANGKPKPWTDDAILGGYRFCNVRRMDDRVSLWLLDNWYKPYYDHQNMLVAAILARFFNKPEALVRITFILETGSKPNLEAVKKTMRELKAKGETIFNGAYMVRGNDGVDKVSSVVDYYLKSVLDKKVEVDRSSMENTWAALCECYGWGSFMAGQVVADLRHAMKGSWSDRLTWAPIGPGSARGMNRIHERPIKQPLSQESFMEELLALIEIGRAKLPKWIYSRLEAQDWQNTLCEYDKYCRALLGEGKPKQKYPGGV